MISVIITIYKKQDTIRRCLESIINQSYKDLEVILINDDLGETIPFYEDLISTLENNYKLIIYTNDINVGAGLSRRKGVELSTGEYTSFLDADDYLKPDYFEHLIKAAESTNAELISSGFICVKGDNYTERKDIYGEYTGESKFRVDKFDSLRFLNPCLVKSNLWDEVTYSKERFIEDSPVLFKLVYNCNKRVVIDYAGYYYTQNENSLCHSAELLKVYIYRALSSADVYTFLKNKKDVNTSKKALLSFLECCKTIKELKIEDDSIKKYSIQLAELYKFFITNFKL